MELKGMPMPPSVNALYRNARRRPFEKGPGRVKTPKYKQYELEMLIWVSRNRAAVDLAQAWLAGLRRESKDFRLHLVTTFQFERKKILTKDGSIRRNDTSNRIKALHDVLSQILLVDDCHFWSETYDKRVGTSDLVEVKLELKTDGRP